MIPRAAGIKSCENHWDHQRCPRDKGVSKDRKQKRIWGKLLNRRPMLQDNVPNGKRDTTNSGLVDHKDKSPSMVDESHKD